MLALTLLPWEAKESWAEGGTANREPVQVVASIKPLTLITRALVEGTDIQVDTLLPPGASPHHYALRISDAQRLRAAQLVIWLGPAAEPYMNDKLFKKSLPLLGLVDSRQLLTEEDDHLPDPHVWLDPDIALSLARTICAELEGLYPSRKLAIARNLAHFEEELGAMDQKLDILLSPYKNKPFMVYHDAYGYFFRHYGFDQAMVVQTHPGESGLSVKHFSEMQRAIQDRKAICLFGEPEYANAPLPEFGSGLEVKRGELDPLGIQAQSYRELMENLAGALQACLKTL